ncbi:hypothetical protein H4I96_02823 [Botrytis cinerea]
MVNQQQSPNPHTNSSRRSKRVAKKRTQASPHDSEESSTITVFQSKGLLRTPPPQAEAGPSISTSNHFAVLDDNEEDSDSPTPGAIMPPKGKEPDKEEPPAWANNLLNLITQQNATIAELRLEINDIRTSHSSRSNSRNRSPAPREAPYQSVLDTIEPVDPTEATIHPSHKKDTHLVPDSISPRQPTFDKQGTTFSTPYRVEKIPHLTEKLSDGKALKPKLWKYLIECNLEQYAYAFTSERQRRIYIVANTEGIARDHLQPLLLDPSPEYDAQGLIEAAVQVTTDPAEQRVALDQYETLRQGANQPFWEFYQKFRQLANTAGIQDSSTLLNNLRNRINTRLAYTCVTEFASFRSVNDYAALLQIHDVNYRSIKAREYATASATRSNPTSNRTTASQQSRSTPKTSQEIPQHSANTVPPRLPSNHRSNTVPISNNPYHNSQSWKSNGPARNSIPTQSDSRIQEIIGADELFDSEMQLDAERRDRKLDQYWRRRKSPILNNIHYSSHLISQVNSDYEITLSDNSTESNISPDIQALEVPPQESSKVLKPLKENFEKTSKEISSILTTTGNTFKKSITRSIKRMNEILKDLSYEVLKIIHLYLHLVKGAFLPRIHQIAPKRLIELLSLQALHSI